MTHATFRAVFEEHYVRVLRYVESSVGVTAAEEITAEVFTVAWQKFDVREPFRLPWLIRVASGRVVYDTRCPVSLLT